MGQKFFVYVLQNPSGKRYVGQTDDWGRRASFSTTIRGTLSLA